MIWNPFNDPGSAIRRRYRLRDWTLVFGLPTNAHEYAKSHAAGGIGGLGIETFDDYANQVLAPFEEQVTDLQTLGLRVLRYPDSKAVASRARGSSCMLIYTHCSEGRLEFADGMVPFDDVVSRLSPSFFGLLDFCTCRPAGLIGMIKQRAPACTVVTRTVELNASGWIAYFARLLCEFVTPTTYWDAALKANHMLQDRSEVPAPTLPALDSYLIIAEPDKAAGLRSSWHLLAARLWAASRRKG